MPPWAVRGPPGVVVAPSILTWLENGSGGEWVRLETERINWDLKEPCPCLSTKGLSQLCPSFLHFLPGPHSAQAHSPAHIVCLGPGLGAEVGVTDLFLYQVFHPVVHL